MKKIIASSIIIGTFVLYSFFEATTKSTPAVSTTESLSQASATNTTTPTVTQQVSGTTGPTNTPQITVSPTSTSGYKDGTYTGTRSNAYYGYIQVKVTIAGGKISDVQFLEYPNDHHESVEINTRAMPLLQKEAITAQSAQVNIVSRATDSSLAFIESMKSALSQAKS